MRHQSQHYTYLVYGKYLNESISSMKPACSSSRLRPVDLSSRPLAFKVHGYPLYKWYSEYAFFPIIWDMGLSAKSEQPENSRSSQGEIHKFNSSPFGGAMQKVSKFKWKDCSFSSWQWQLSN